MKSYYREYMPLRLGANEYSGYQIDAAQIVTIGKGLCYKLEFLEKSKFWINLDFGKISIGPKLMKWTFGLWKTGVLHD